MFTRRTSTYRGSTYCSTKFSTYYLINLPVYTAVLQLYVPVLVRSACRYGRTTAVYSRMCTHEQCVIVAVTVPLFIYIKSSKILQEVRGRVLNNSVEG